MWKTLAYLAHLLIAWRHRWHPTSSLSSFSASPRWHAAAVVDAISLIRSTASIVSCVQYDFHIVDSSTPRQRFLRILWLVFIENKTQCNHRQTALASRVDDFGLFSNLSKRSCCCHIFFAIFFTKENKFTRFTGGNCKLMLNTFADQLCECNVSSEGEGNSWPCYPGCIPCS